MIKKSRWMLMSLVCLAGMLYAQAPGAPSTVVAEPDWDTPITLHFKDLELRAVLEMMADILHVNLVTSDAVRGRVTLRLDNIPSGQALDLILQTKGLGKRIQGNVLLIAPMEELLAREKFEWEANKQAASLGALQRQFFTIRYAKATELVTLLLKDTQNVLTTRGSVVADMRTNTVIVEEVAERMEHIAALIQALDVPVRQVLIESRIVVIDDRYEKTIGRKFGFTAETGSAGLARSVEGSNALLQNSDLKALPVAERLSVQLPQPFKAQGLQAGLSVHHIIPGTLIDLELQALESEGLGKIISSPRLITAHQQSAYIESGEEIPYQEAASSGATSVTFKKAVLRLEVKPQITPDGHILLELTVNQDTRGDPVLQTYSINTQEIHTQVLVQDGQTLVLGGIYKHDRKQEAMRVPILSKIPVLGALFKSSRKVDRRSELLIFVTPHILGESTEKVGLKEDE